MRRLAEEVARLPEVCEAMQLSTAGYLRAIGLPERRLLLEPEALAETFRQNPELIAQWLKRSHDQRITGGWCIERQQDQYKVQRFTNERDHLSFDDAPLAVAMFVVRYVAFICDVLARA